MGVRGEVGSIPTLDGVRGIAVLWVMAFHYAVLAPASDPLVAAVSAVPSLDGLVRNGYLGVDLFFLLSGFLLVLPWLARAERGERPPAARQFYRRRILRIVPAYYVHLALLFAVILPLLGGWMYWRPDAYVVAWNAVAHGLFLQLTSPLTSGTLGVNGALWTLAIEAQFYLLLPLLAPVFVRRPLPTMMGALAMAELWRWGAAHDLAPLVSLQLRLGAHWGWPEGVVRHLLHTQLPSYMAHFALGALLARAWMPWRASGPPRPGWLAIGTLVAFVMLLLSTGGPVAPWSANGWSVTTLALAMLLFAAALARGRLSQAILGRGPLALVGRVSYSAYLYHLPVLLLAKKYLPPSPLIFPAAYLALVLVVAWASWRFVERRFLERPT